MDTFRDRLEHLQVHERRAAIVPVVLVLVVARDAVRALHRRERERRGAGDARDDGLGVEGEDRRVHVDLVRVEDRRVWEGFEDGRWELVDVGERVFIWTV